MGEYVDTVRGLDWQRARMKEASSPCRPRTRRSPTPTTGSPSSAPIFGVLTEGVARGFYAENPKPVVTTPRAARYQHHGPLARVLNGVTFSAPRRASTPPPSPAPPPPSEESVMPGARVHDPQKIKTSFAGRA